MGNIIVSRPNEALVISGCRGSQIKVGKCGFVFMCCETWGKLSLEIMTLKLHSQRAETSKGVPVSVKGVAQVKVMANKYLKINAANASEYAGMVVKKGPAAVVPSMGEEEKEDEWVETAEIDIAKIKIASQHFLGRERERISEALHETMEGHQRQILGTLTVEQLYRDRAAFSASVRSHVNEDLNTMGFVLVSYTVTEIKDDQGYMEALGATQTALVRREAEEGKARNENEARKKVAQYKSEADIASARAVRESHIESNTQLVAQAESDRDLNMKKAQYKKETNKANEEAEAQTRITKAEQDKVVIREQTQQREEEAKVLVNVAKQEVERIKAEASGRSEAELLRQQNEAKGVLVEAQAEAERIRNVGEAEAAAIQKKGEAEAAVMRQKAEAFKQYGEAAIVQSIVDKMPEIAEKIAKPLERTEKMIFISQDGQAGSQLTKDIVSIVGTVPDAVEGLTGINLRGALGRLAQNDAQ
jgi:flotillin